MRFVLLVIAALLIVGCDYFDDSEDTLHDDSGDTLNPILYDSTPVVIPTDADWELIATLERNPLRPATFYIFDWQKEIVNQAYLDGKHFIFEIGGEYRDKRKIVVRHYIIQPTAPFLDEDKHIGQVVQWKEEGVRFHVHYYAFLSEGWYVAKEYRDGGGQAIGLGVHFDITDLKPIEEFPDPAQTIHGLSIGLIDKLDTVIIGKGLSFIEPWVRLRIFVSQ